MVTRKDLDCSFVRRLSALLTITPVLVLGPVLHVHVVSYGTLEPDDSSLNPAAAAGHSCCHHAACRKISESPKQVPSQSGDPAEHSDCSVCLVLAQSRQTPQVITCTEVETFVVWITVPCDDFSEGTSPLSVQSRGPPA